MLAQVIKQLLLLQEEEQPFAIIALNAVLSSLVSMRRGMYSILLIEACVTRVTNAVRHSRTTLPT